MSSKEGLPLQSLAVFRRDGIQLGFDSSVFPQEATNFAIHKEKHPVDTIYVQGILHSESDTVAQKPVRVTTTNWHIY